jgi:N-acyl amino acid synthase of PEP-CTERM/exosortase system
VARVSILSFMNCQFQGLSYYMDICSSSIHSNDSLVRDKPKLLVNEVYLDDRLSVVLADSPKLKNIVYHIRFKVYCEQFRFECPSKYPDRLEHDIYDEIATHFLLKDRKTGCFLGTMRLIRPVKCGEITSVPLESAYGGVYFNERFDPSKLDVGAYCEVSRVAMLSSNPGVSSIYGESHESQFKRLVGSGARGLYFACLAYFDLMEKDAEHIFCLMENRLAIRLNKLGFPFMRVGTSIDFRGSRAPFYLHRTHAADSLLGDNRVLYLRLKFAFLQATDKSNAEAI